MRFAPNHDEGKPVNPVQEMLQAEIKAQKPESLAEIQAIASEVMGRYNSAPQDELNGLAPTQVRLLTAPGWMEKALTLNEQLSVDDLAGAQLLQNARCVLRAINEVGVVKATATGAFNRKFALQMLEEFDLPERVRKDVYRYNKVINQLDVPDLELIRLILPTAGLLLYRKGEFHLTRLARKLLADSVIGSLYDLLFRTVYQKISLDSLSGLPDAPHIQNTIGFFLYQTGQYADGWIEISELAPKVFLPVVLHSLPLLSWTDPGTQYVYCTLRTLRDFGLVEFDDDKQLKAPERVRITAIFDRFIQFNVSQLSAVGHRRE